MNEILDIANLQLKSLGYIDVFKIQSLTKSSLEYIKEVLNKNDMLISKTRYGKDDILNRVERFG